MKIAYEPHPVTPERKAELRAAGFRIIDERFKPADAEPVIGGIIGECGGPEIEIPKRTRTRKVAE